MAEAFYATHEFLSIIRSSGPIFSEDIIVRTLSVGGDTAQAGHIVNAYAETAGYVDLADHADEESHIGVILGPVLPEDSYDLDDTITDGSEVYVLKKRPRGAYQVALLHAPVASETTLVEGTAMAVGTTAGQVIAWAYTDAKGSTDTSMLIVGTLAHYDTMSSTAVSVCVVNWR